MNIRKKLFTKRVMKKWNRLPKEVVDVPGGVQGWVGQGPGQLGLVGGVPAYDKGLELGGL